MGELVSKPLTRVDAMKQVNTFLKRDALRTEFQILADGNLGLNHALFEELVTYRIAHPGDTISDRTLLEIVGAPDSRTRQTVNLGLWREEFWDKFKKESGYGQREKDFALTAEDYSQPKLS